MIETIVIFIQENFCAPYQKYLFQESYFLQ